MVGKWLKHAPNQSRTPFDVERWQAVVEVVVVVGLTTSGGPRVKTTDHDFF